MTTIDISADIHSLTDFKRNTAEFMEQLEESGRPVVLTVNGQAKLVVQDAAAYQRLLELVNQIKVLEGIQAGLESMREGRGIPFEQFKAEMQKKYGIPSKRPDKK
ncbi:MAG: type II toxin-antitoxin system Phd/YefM family antitoxin [Blastocatellia bacterium]